MSEFYLEIVSALKKHGDKKIAESEKYYHKYDRYESYGLRMPVLRNLLNRYKKDIQKLSCKDALALARKFFTSHIEEQVLAGNYVLHIKRDCLILARFNYLDKALGHLNSWSTIDDFCMNVFQSILLEYPKKALVILRGWNKSKNMWKRRASVVVFTRKVGESGKFAKEALEFCENLIWAKEDLVRKAVGWCLKDVMRGDKKRVLAYVKDLRQRGVPSVITSYALRDMGKEEKQRILSRKVSPK